MESIKLTSKNKNSCPLKYTSTSQIIFSAFSKESFTCSKSTMESPYEWKKRQFYLEFPMKCLRKSQAIVINKKVTCTIR